MKCFNISKTFDEYNYREFCKQPAKFKVQKALIDGKSTIGTVLEFITIV